MGSSVEVILTETIDTLGEEGDVVKVKPGYARNYLFPQSKAVAATNANRVLLAQEQSAIEGRKERQRHEAEELAKRIAGSVVVIEQRVGEEDRLYGSVTSADIAARLAGLGIQVDRKRIQLSEPIKTLGEFAIPIKVGYQVTSDIKVQVVPVGSAAQE